MLLALPVCPQNQQTSAPGGQEDVGHTRPHRWSSSFTVSMARGLLLSLGLASNTDAGLSSARALAASMLGGMKDGTYLVPKRPAAALGAAPAEVPGSTTPPRTKVCGTKPEGPASKDATKSSYAAAASSSRRCAPGRKDGECQHAGQQSVAGASVLRLFLCFLCFFVQLLRDQRRHLAREATQQIDR